MNRWCIVALSGALLGGCAATSGPPAVPPVELPTAAAPVGLIDELGRAPIGDRRTLSGGNPLNSREVTLVGAYQAASGRPCRRLVLASGTRRIICRGADDRWSLQRQIGLSTPGVGPAGPR